MNIPSSEGSQVMLATFTSHLLLSALIVHSMAKIDLDTLTSLLCEEGDRLKGRSMCGKPSQGGRNSPGTEEAFVATGPRRGPTQRRGKCRRCVEEGHWAHKCCTPKKEGSATAPAAQASLGATSPPETHVGEAHTILEIAGESWLAEEEVVHAQMVDAEPDLTSGHPEDPHEVAHAQMVDAVPDLTWGHPENEAVVAHAQLASAEPDPLLGDQDNLEDKAHAQTVDAGTRA